MNKVLLIGRLAADPVEKITTTNKKQSMFSLACNGPFRGANSQNNTNFLPCMAWEMQANYINTYLKKGDLVSLEGHINRGSYVSKQTNQTVFTMNIVVETITKLSNNDPNRTPTTQSEPTISLNQLFPENGTITSKISEQKMTPPSYSDDGDIEWLDEIKNKDKGDQ